jgi:hypothetical protein
LPEATGNGIRSAIVNARDDPRDVVNAFDE